MGSSGFSAAPMAAKASDPRHGDVFVAYRIPAHGLSQTAGLLEIIIRPPFELGHRALGKELGRAAPVGDLPCRRLGTVLAELEQSRFLGAAVRATDAGEPVRLVLPEERQRALDRDGFAQENLGEAFRRAPSADGPVVRLDADVAMLRRCHIISPGRLWRGHTLALSPRCRHRHFLSAQTKTDDRRLSDKARPRSTRGSGYFRINRCFWRVLFLYRRGANAARREIDRPLGAGRSAAR